MRRCAFSLIFYSVTACHTAFAAAAPVCPTAMEQTDDQAILLHLKAALKQGGILNILSIGAGPVAPATPASPQAVQTKAPQTKALVHPPTLAMELARVLSATVKGLQVSVQQPGGAARTASDQLDMIKDALRTQHPALVLWQTGTRDAVNDEPDEDFAQTIAEGADIVASAGADLVLIEPQYSRFLEANANVAPYIAAMESEEAVPGIYVFHRYALMHEWADAGLIDLEEAPIRDRAAVAARLHACLAEELARGLLAGIQ